MTLQQLYDVIVISETGSLNRAAEKLFVSQPALTGAVRELEKELSITIFNRTPRGMTLTTEGPHSLLRARVKPMSTALNVVEPASMPRKAVPR